MNSWVNLVEKMAAKAWRMNAMILIQLGLNEPALKCLDRVLKIEPNCREAIVDNAMVLCRLAEAHDAKRRWLEY